MNLRRSSTDSDRDFEWGLGELFDHGCDSITMGMIALVLGAAVRLGGMLTLVGLIVSWGPFYLAHWEEYHTGILIMGKFNGPTETQLIVIGVCGFSSFTCLSLL